MSGVLMARIGVSLSNIARDLKMASMSEMLASMPRQRYLVVSGGRQSSVSIQQYKNVVPMPQKALFWGILHNCLSGHPPCRGNIVWSLLRVARA